MVVFSVVIPVYNRENLIQGALDSVFEQTIDDYEVIVVDDGSTDGTLAALAAYRDRIQLIEQPNKGPGVARNTGVEAAKGEYVAFLDSDDRWFPWTLSTYQDAINRHGFPSFLSASEVYFHGDNLPTAETEPLQTTEFNDFLQAAGRGRYISSSSIAVKRRAFERVGGFATANMNAEDHDLAFRLGTEHGFVQIEAPALVARRRHDSQVTEDTLKTWRGLSYLLDQEASGAYPGGPERRSQRRYLLCQHVRGASLSLVRTGHEQKALDLYRRTLSWQLSFGRFRYVAGFPLAMMWNTLAGQFRE